VLAAERRTFALDLRNHGQSPHAEEMTYAAMVADVAAWLDARAIGPADIIGHSMGGKVAMLLACRQPARVGRLVVVDIVPRAYSWPDDRAEFAAMGGIDLATLGSRAEAEGLLEGPVPSWAMRKFLVSSLERVPGGWKWQFNLPGIRAALRTLELNPLEPGDRFEGPALFVTGAKSRYVQPGDENAIRAHFPSARIETLAGAGHNPHIDSREAFVAAVRSAG
jgi:pimeloyl-ACP methyl ester carboxylesterase